MYQGMGLAQLSPAEKTAKIQAVEARLLALIETAKKTSLKATANHGMAFNYQAINF